MNQPYPILDEIELIEFEDVVEIQRQVIDEDEPKGFMDGARGEGLLHSALHRIPAAISYGEPYEKEFVRLAALYWHGISANHCFRNANKRTGFMAMLTFLNINGWEFADDGNFSGEAIEQFFKEHRFEMDVLVEVVRGRIRPLVD